MGSPSQDTPSQDTFDRVRKMFGRAPVRWARVRRGWAPTERWVVGFEDGASAFVKLATTEHTAGALRAENEHLDWIRGSFVPARLGWSDDGRPTLALEDLSHARWPPPWDADLIGRTIALLETLRDIEVPDGVRQLEEGREQFLCWKEVEEDPSHFLSLDYVSEAWLRRALSTLREAEEAARMEGDAICHNDVRSDNMCFLTDRSVLVDWNVLRRGNPLWDLASWLPSLHAEGGPAPEEILPGQGELAALFAGYFAHRAGQPPMKFPGAARIRWIQRVQLSTCLPWACRELGIPAPDGELTIYPEPDHG